MTGGEHARLDLVGLLAAVENASPVAAADVLAERLADALGASEVSFLVADFSGRALVRLGHAGRAAATRTQGRETAERVPLDGSPHGRALAGQTLEVGGRRARCRLFAPVTNRGEAIGVLELSLPEPPDEQTLATSRWPRTRSRTSSSPTAGSPTSSSGASARSGCRSPPRSSIACCRAPTRARPGSSRSRPGWSPPATSPGTRSTSRSSATRCICRSPTRWATRSTPRCSPRCSSARCATPGGPASGSPSRPASPTPGSADYTGWSDFVTGQVARIDLRSQTATIVNAGHPLPLRLRDGRVDRVPLEADPPFGIVRGHRVPRPALAAAAGRPADVPHRRHDRAQRRRGHRSADGGRRGDASARSGAASRARRPRGHRRRRPKTTRRSCASTGTADRRASD